MTHDSNKDLNKIGKRVILPSSVTISDKYMHQQYLDTIESRQKFGHSYVFLPLHLIQNERKWGGTLREGETALNKSNLVLRILN